MYYESAQQQDFEPHFKCVIRAYSEGILCSDKRNQKWNKIDRDKCIFYAHRYIGIFLILMRQILMGC